MRDSDKGASVEDKDPQVSAGEAREGEMSLERVVAEAWRSREAGESESESGRGRSADRIGEIHKKGKDSETTEPAQGHSAWGGGQGEAGLR